MKASLDCWLWQWYAYLFQCSLDLTWSCEEFFPSPRKGFWNHPFYLPSIVLKAIWYCWVDQLHSFLECTKNSWLSHAKSFYCFSDRFVIQPIDSFLIVHWIFLGLPYWKIQSNSCRMPNFESTPDLLICFICLATSNKGTYHNWPRNYLSVNRLNTFDSLKMAVLCKKHDCNS